MRVHSLQGSMIDVRDITEFCRGRHDFNPKENYFQYFSKVSLGATRNTVDPLNQTR